MIINVTNTNEKALTSGNNSDKRRQHISKCLTFCVFIYLIIDLENPNPYPQNVILIRQQFSECDTNLRVHGCKEGTDKM